MKQWIKAAAITGPLLILGTVYAFASSGSGVSFTIHPSQSSSQSDAIQSQSTSSAATSGTNIDASVQNPFLVASGQTTTTSSQASLNNVTQSSSDLPFSVASIQHLLVQASSVDGKIILNFTSDKNGNANLVGTIGKQHFHYKGSAAIGYLNSVFKNWNLQDIISSALTNGSAQWNIPQGLQLHVEHFDMQLLNQQQIHLNAHDEKPKAGQTQEEQSEVSQAVQTQVEQQPQQQTQPVQDQVQEQNENQAGKGKAHGKKQGKHGEPHQGHGDDHESGSDD